MLSLAPIEIQKFNGKNFQEIIKRTLGKDTYELLPTEYSRFTRLYRTYYAHNFDIREYGFTFFDLRNHAISSGYVVLVEKAEIPIDDNSDYAILKWLFEHKLSLWEYYAIEYYGESRGNKYVVSIYAHTHAKCQVWELCETHKRHEYYNLNECREVKILASW